ncbi:contractile injection system protein, VgrG/Pvc8 family [Achromobacter sp. AGC78]
MSLRANIYRFTFTPASGAAFDVIEFTLDEALSETYRLCIELSSIDPAIDFGTLLDQPALFTIWRGEHAVRHVHGIVTELVQADTGFRRTRYRLVVEPSLVRLAAEEGYFYRYVHSEHGHRLIHGDRIYIHGEIEGGPVVYNPMPGGDQAEPALHRFAYAERVRTAVLPTKANCCCKRNTTPSASRPTKAPKSPPANSMYWSRPTAAMRRRVHQDGRREY